MADCTPQSVASGASCFMCVSEKVMLGEMVYLLNQILAQEKAMPALTPQEVADGAECYACNLSGKMLYAAIVYLLCQIEGGGGGVGGGNFRAGSGLPVGNAPGAPRTAYEDDETGVIYVQNPDGTWPTLP